jgi:hypothetical protein
MAYNKNGPHSTLGPDPKSGSPKDGFFAKPDGSDAPHTHHEQPHYVRGQERQQSDNLGLARASKAGKHLPDVPVALGQRSRTSPLPGMLTMTTVEGVPDAANPNPLDVMTPSQAGKRLDPLRVHSAFNRGSADDYQRGQMAEVVMGEAIEGSRDSQHPANMAKRSAAALPASTEES